MNELTLTYEYVIVVFTKTTITLKKRFILNNQYRTRNIQWWRQRNSIYRRDLLIMHSVFNIGYSKSRRDNQLANFEQWKENLKPASFYFWNPIHDFVIELPEGKIKESKTQIGDQIKFNWARINPRLSNVTYFIKNSVVSE